MYILQIVRESVFFEDLIGFEKIKTKKNKKNKIINKTTGLTFLSRQTTKQWEMWHYYTQFIY